MGPWLCFSSWKSPVLCTVLRDVVKAALFYSESSREHLKCSEMSQEEHSGGAGRGKPSPISTIHAVQCWGWQRQPWQPETGASDAPGIGDGISLIGSFILIIVTIGYWPLLGWLWYTD